jgi:hypothetical protein
MRRRLSVGSASLDSGCNSTIDAEADLPDEERLREVLADPCRDPRADLGNSRRDSPAGRQSSIPSFQTRSSLVIRPLRAIALSCSEENGPSSSPFLRMNHSDAIDLLTPSMVDGQSRGWAAKLA